MSETEEQAQLSLIIERLRRLGTDTATIEVKEASGGLPKSIGETLSAFGNAAGGLLLLGLSERRGFSPAPGFDAPRIRDALARACSDDMDPPVRAPVEIHEFDDAAIVVLEVPQVDPLRQPVHIKRKGPYDGSYIRGGDGDRRLTAYEVTQLLSNRTQPLEDAEIVGTASLQDLDEGRVAALGKRLRAQSPRAFGNLDDEGVLLRLRAAASDREGTLRPTLAGLMCLGQYPQQFYPQLFISFVALPGREMGDSLADGTRFLDNVSCDGPIPDVVEAVLAAARRNMRTAAVIREAGRQDRYDYPLEVIRELVVNALMHRDYSSLSRGTQVQVELYPDRLVVKSPGGLFGSVVESQLGVEQVSSSRNSILAKLLADVPGDDGKPVCENRGSGLSRVMSQLRESGMTPPTFDVSPAYVHVTVPQHGLLDPETLQWITQLHVSGLDNTQHLALAMMRARGSVSNEMLRAWGVDPHVATLALRGLVERGLATKFGGRRYATYELVDDQRGRLPIELGESYHPRATGARARRIEAELQAVLEAIRAGNVTSRAMQGQLGLSYAAINRRVNTLLREGRIRATAPPHSRARAYVVLDDQH
ncbi:MAG: ATP-binding protein [Dermatophilaceae bacterium]